MVAIGFLALDFALITTLRKSGAAEWYANLVIGILISVYLFLVFLVIDRPDDATDDRE